MQTLNFPPASFKIVKENGRLKIFDSIRKKYLVLTPEEWVRQNVIRFLIDHRSFPQGLLQMETGVKYYQKKGRTDALFVNRNGIPVVLIECKAPDVVISQKTLDQVSRYNSSIKASFIILTNGLKHFFMKVDFLESKLITLTEIPSYQYLSDQSENDG